MTAQGKSYAQLLEENIALKLLLEEAHTYGNHAWSCGALLKITDTCDCWYGQTAEVLIEESRPVLAMHPVATIPCKVCSHLARDHQARIVGQPQAACCECNCNCMAFVPKEIPS